MNIFEQNGLKIEILKAIDDLGFIEPTPIQLQTIPVILESERDLIGLAQTGTGKTAGFGLPILQKVDLSEKSVQAIILSPTRELAMQICKDFESFSKYIPDFKIVAVYGGASIGPQLATLKKGVQVVVGTPGRTLDLIKRKALKISNIRWLVLDEADEMLNMGFRDELDAILENTPQTKQTLLFSATMPDGVRRIAQNYLNNPVELSAGTKNIGAENVEHHYYVVKASDRYLALKRLADYHPSVYGIIFCRTRSETKEVATKLMEDGYNADALHGDLSQAQRDYVMQRFRAKQLQLLVATDVAARGLDIDDLTHIINYNLPDDHEVYIHRSGRTGRAGKKGVSIIICHTREGRRVKEIEKLVSKKFEQKPVPSGEEICEKRLFNLIDKIENIVIDEEKIAPYLPTIMKKLEWLDRDELLKRIVYVEFDRFLSYYKNAKDLNASAQTDRKKPEKDRFSSKEYVRFFINVGSKNNIKPQNLLGLINEYTGSNSISIGKIDVQRNFSFFEVEKSAEAQVLEAFNGKSYGSITLQVQPSKEEPTRRDRNDNFKRKDRKYGDFKKPDFKKNDKYKKDDRFKKDDKKKVDRYKKNDKVKKSDDNKKEDKPKRERKKW